MATTTSRSSALCQRCMEFDILTKIKRSLLSLGVLAPQKSKADFLWTTSDILATHSCIFCSRILAPLLSHPSWKAIPQPQTIEGQFIAIRNFDAPPFPPLAGRLLELRLPMSRAEDGTKVKEAVPAPSYFVRPIPSDDSTTLVDLYHDMPKLLKTHLGRVVGSTFDQNLVRQWLLHCELNHDRACKPSPGPEKLRLISVAERCIVSATPEARFAALSYVWGNQGQVLLLRGNYAEMNKPGAFDKISLPRTIAHSIEISSRTGIPYIWADALCIIQDDPEDVKLNIHQMDQIYSAATVVIAAVSADSATSGVAGVDESNPRAPQIQAQVGAIRIAVSASDVTQAIFSSTWSSRAWTLQEMLLAKRILYVLDDQVVFRCRKALWKEDTYLEYAIFDKVKTVESASDTILTAHIDATMIPSEACIRQDSKDLDGYFRYVSLLCQRSITNPGDLLDAFMAVMNVYTPVVGSFYWGLPVRGFVDNLLWNNIRAGASIYKELVGSESRRCQFPSWSWAGWTFGPGVNIKLPERSLFQCSKEQARFYLPSIKHSGFSIRPDEKMRPLTVPLPLQRYFSDPPRPISQIICQPLNSKVNTEHVIYIWATTFKLATLKQISPFSSLYERYVGERNPHTGDDYEVCVISGYTMKLSIQVPEFEAPNQILDAFLLHNPSVLKEFLQAASTIESSPLFPKDGSWTREEARAAIDRDPKGRRELLQNYCEAAITLMRFARVAFNVKDQDQEPPNAAGIEQETSNDYVNALVVRWDQGVAYRVSVESVIEIEKLEGIPFEMRLIPLA